MSLSLSLNPTLSPAQPQAVSPLTPEMQLLLTCARLKLTSRQQQRLNQLCGEVSDWSALMHQANHHLIAPLVYRHLKAIASPSISALALEQMRALCQKRIMRMMAMAAVQQRLVQQVLQPLGVAYVLLKGPSLAQRYYGGLGLRQCRDIDVLVDPARLLEVVDAIVACGYRIDLRDCNNRQDLEAACRYRAVVTVVSPKGSRIELHQRLDDKGHVFDPDYLLSKAEPFTANGVLYQVLPTSALFVYICYHHSRHQWAHLHWLTDLDAFQRHPSFDRQSVEAFATEVGLRATVGASLALHRVCGSATPHGVELACRSERSMRDGCLRSLASQEQIKALHGRRADIFDAWFIWLRYLVIVAFRPDYDDYKALPLPRVWQWVYYLIHPFRMARKTTVKLLLRQNLKITLWNARNST